MIATYHIHKTTQYPGAVVVGPTASSFTAAKQYCESIGSNLASIHSSAENSIARTECMNTDASTNGGVSGCWIGLFLDDVNTPEGQWKWIDGSTLDYGFDSNGDPTTTQNDPWYPGEPNDNGGNENYIHYFVPQQFNWNDAPGNSPNYPICNDPPTPSPTLDGCDFMLNTYLEECYCDGTLENGHLDSAKVPPFIQIKDDDNDIGQIVDEMRKKMDKINENDGILSKYTFNEFKNQHILNMENMMSMMNVIKIMIFLAFLFSAVTILGIICLWSKFGQNGYKYVEKFERRSGKN